MSLVARRGKNRAVFEGRENKSIFFLSFGVCEKAVSDGDDEVGD